MNNKINGDDLKKVTGGNGTDNTKLYSFESGDTFASGIIYYVVAENYTNVEATTDIRLVKYSNPAGQFILHYNTAIQAGILKEKYQYLGKDYIKR